MSPKDLSIPELLAKLAQGWAAGRGEFAYEFLARWKTRLAVSIAAEEVSENAARFTAECPQIRLRGMDSVPGLLVGGSAEAATAAIMEFRRTTGAPGRTPFIFACSDAAVEAAERVLPAGFFLILGPAVLAAWFAGDKPLAALKEQLRKQIPLESLSPFNFQRAAPGHMFFGRRRELNCLLQQEDISFGVAGPARIGKTSLMQQYRRELMRLRGRRASRVIALDCYEWENNSEDSLARHIALAVAPSRRSSRISAGDLVPFLRMQKETLGGPVELLLDEVDGVCFDPAFDKLAEAVRTGLCRVVLFGKGNLLRLMLSQKSQWAGRLELLRPEPLETAAARALLTEPLRDLGFEIEEPDAIIQQVLHLTGCLPHQLQFYGKKLVGQATADKQSVVRRRHVEQVREDMLTFEYFTSPLLELPPTAHAVAIALLKHLDQRRSPAGAITAVRLEIPTVIAVAEQAGLSLGGVEAWDVCNELLIHNVLAWEAGTLRIANASLVHYARKLGLLDAAPRIPQPATAP